MRLITCCLFLILFSLHPKAQVIDNFSDGDFTANPVWSGNTAEFIVNAAQELQLNSSGVNLSYLSTDNLSTNLDSTEWSFFIHLNFSPSAGNYARVYLAADTNVLEASLNGYYLQFGEALSNDAVELFRQDGSTSTSVCRGTNGQIATSFSIGVKVTRSNTGVWNLYVDAAGGTNYSLEATGNDVTYNTSESFGVLCNYTATNATSFYFDDFFVGPIVVDLTAPTLVSANASSVNTVDVLFSETVDQSSAELLGNYSADNSLGSPVSAQRDGVNFSLVHLTFANNFPNGILNTLTVNSVKDISNNTIAANSSTTFVFTMPQSKDIIFTEILFDPDPAVNLPNKEFVEIYNRSNKTIDLLGWTFKDATTSVYTLPSVVMQPQSYVIICNAADAASFSPFGTVAAINGFPSLNNTGSEDVFLSDNTGLEIDHLTFDESFYQNTLKAAGGWSIERIDPNFTCDNAGNWKASENANGGTPGTLNSVNGIFIDNAAPYIVNLCVVNSSTVTLTFNEAIQANVLSDVNSYSVYNAPQNPLTPLSAISSSDLLSVTLTMPFTISATGYYQVKTSALLKDCAGNATAAESFFFNLPSTPDSGDIVFNEILAHIQSGGSEYVEIYNRSLKAFDLSQLRITKRDLVTGQLDLPVAVSSSCALLLPGEYAVLTDNPSIVKSFYTILNNKAFIQMSLPSLTDGEDDLVLMTSALTILDEVHYYEDWQFPLIDNTAGVSLERINSSRPSNDATNWHSASQTAGFGTPGYENSQSAPSEVSSEEWLVSPELFSPDNDGNNDVVNFNYNFDQPGFIANASIYDAAGRKIKTLLSNELLGTSGTYSWDGISDEKEKARTGIYVVYFEVFNVNGDVKKYKKVCTLATKL